MKPLALPTLGLFSRLLAHDIVDIEKPDEMRLPTSVADKYLGSFLNSLMM